MNPTMRLHDWGWLLVLSTLWGGSFFFVEIALRELPTFTVVLGRVGFAAILLLAYVIWKQGQMPLSPQLWGRFLILGALNGAIPYSLIVWGQVYIESGLASILNATTPLFSVVLTHFFTQEERITPQRVLGCLLGFCGVVVLIGKEALLGVGQNVLGQVAILGAALSYAFAGIYGRRRFKSCSLSVTAAGQVTGTALIVAPFALFFEQPWQYSPNLATWGAIGGLAFLSTAVAYLIYFHILTNAGATNVLLVTFLIPLSALLLGVWLLGEQVTWSLFLGMLLILCGILFIDGRVVRWLQAKAILKKPT